MDKRKTGNFKKRKCQHKWDSRWHPVGCDIAEISKSSLFFSFLLFCTGLGHALQTATRYLDRTEVQRKAPRPKEEAWLSSSYNPGLLIISRSCSENVEYLTLRWRPFYLPREPQCIMVSVLHTLPRRSAKEAALSYMTWSMCTKILILMLLSLFWEISATVTSGKPCLNCINLWPPPPGETKHDRC